MSLYPPNDYDIVIHVKALFLAFLIAAHDDQAEFHEFWDGAPPRSIADFDEFWTCEPTEFDSCEWIEELVSKSPAALASIQPTGSDAVDAALQRLGNRKTNGQET